MNTIGSSMKRLGIGSANCILRKASCTRWISPGWKNCSGTRSGKRQLGARSMPHAGWRRGMRIVICTNTMHKMAEEVQACLGMPLLHVVDVAAATKGHGLATVGLLGTRFTMEEDFSLNVGGSAYLTGKMQELPENVGISIEVRTRDETVVLLHQSICRKTSSTRTRRLITSKGKCPFL